MTLGESRVRVSFNPSSNPDVDDIKRRAADAIDWCDHHLQAFKSDPDGYERVRAMSLAMEHFEDAVMWAVKAIT